MENLPCGAYVCENSAHSIMHGSISDFFVNFEIYAVRSPKNSFRKICLGSKKPMIDILSLYCKYVYKIRISWKLKPNLTYNSTTLGKSQLLQYTRAGQRHYCMKLGYTNYIRGIVNLQTFWPSFHILRSTVKHCVHCAIVIRPQMFLDSKNERK